MGSKAPAQFLRAGFCFCGSQSRTWDAVAVVGRSCGHCLPYMSKRKRIQDLDDYADWVVAEAKEQDWVSRHAFLSRYSRNDTMFRNLQSRLSPDEWLHGCSTCEPPLHGHAIPLREYGSGGHQQKKPRKQLTIRDAFRAAAVAVDTPAVAAVKPGARSCGGQIKPLVHDAFEQWSQLRQCFLNVHRPRIFAQYES